jgi:hypothetical protein
MDDVSLEDLIAQATGSPAVPTVHRSLPLPPVTRDYGDDDRDENDEGDGDGDEGGNVGDGDSDDGDGNEADSGLPDSQLP